MTVSSSTPTERERERDAGSQVEAAPVRRNTWQREAVWRELLASDAFISAQTLHQRLAARGTRIGLATVYRNLASLTEADEADTLQSDEGEALYRACDMEAHHHHLICRECGRAEEIAAEPVETWANAVAAEHGYSEPRHVVDIFGVCPACRADGGGRVPGA